MGQSFTEHDTCAWIVATLPDSGVHDFSAFVFQIQSNSDSVLTPKQFTNVILHEEERHRERSTKRKLKDSATSPLVAFIDTGVTNLPVPPNGGDIAITWNASGIFSL